MMTALAATLLLLGATVPGTAWPASFSGPAEKIVNVAGFRSAHFGMSAEDVLNAIQEDFGKPGTQVDRTIHPIERTELLSIVFDGLLPVGGPASITYIIGYRSKSLSQINVAWGQLAKNEISRENLVSAGSLLVGYFSGRGFAPEQTIQDQPMSDGSIVLFKGSDRSNRTVLLRLLAASQSGGTRADKPGADHDSLMLSYLRDPENPDVYRIAPESSDRRPLRRLRSVTPIMQSRVMRLTRSSSLMSPVPSGRRGRTR